MQCKRVAEIGSDGEIQLTNFSVLTGMNEYPNNKLSLSCLGM
jgi:hypothetical protein